MNRWTLASHLLLIGLALGSEVAVFALDGGPLRAALALSFILVAPGWAIVRLIDLPMDPLARAATSVGISVSIAILIALALFYARVWSVEVATTILVALVVLVVLADLPVLRQRKSFGEADL